MNRLLTNHWIHGFLLMALLGAALVFGASDHPLRKTFQYTAFDALNKSYPRPADDSVIIVDIDDESLKALGQWPWPRTVIAKLVESLTAQGAKAIAFDGVLAEPDRTSPGVLEKNLPPDPSYDAIRTQLQRLPDHDAVLANAIARSGLFVTAFTYGSYAQTSRAPRLVKPILAKKETTEHILRFARPFKTAAVFLPALEDAAAGNGSFMALPEHDGILRKTGMLFSDGTRVYPSLSLEALRVALLGPKGAIRIGQTPEQERRYIDTQYRIVLDEYVIPVERDGVVWVYYREFDRARDYVPALHVLAPDQFPQAAQKIKDRIVFIGSSAEGLKDLRNTPLSLFRPGVEIHANMAEQILQGRYLLRPTIAPQMELAFILVVGLLMIVLAPFISVIVLGGLCAGLIGGIVWGASYGYVQYGLLLDPVYPSLCVFAVFILSTILTYLRTEQERRQVRDAFGHYISPDFMKELTKNPERLKLGGETRDLTIMFTDIRSFTTICEGLTPEEIIQLMNDFLTPMSDLVMQNRGTIDKYMGDAMMAFWNAPLDDPDHARNACRAALGMQAALTPINESVRNRAQALGKKPVLLSAGIGINTGPCAVGNMGSRQRFAYSTLGDAVNLASRLEGQTKTYGVNILIGEETASRIPDFAALEIDLIRVKGKTRPERVFVLLGDETLQKSDAFEKQKNIQSQMLAAYRSGAFSKALALLEACEKGVASSLGLESLQGVYALYRARLQSLMEAPPPDGWDGIYEAQTK